MTNISAVVARDQFSVIVNRAAFGKERVILTRHGKGIAALVPLEDVEILETLENRLDLAEAHAAMVEVEKEGTVPWAKIKKELGL